MRKNRAFTIIELVIVVTIIGLLASVAVPTFMRSRDNTRNSACAENRRVLDDSKQIWMIDNSSTSSDEIQWSDIVPEYTDNRPECPMNGEYSLGELDEASNCSVHGSSFNTSNIAWDWIVDLLD